jgi:hypothetical protein
MRGIKLFLYLWVLFALLLAIVILQQGSVIRQQRDLIRQMETNPKCMVAPTGGNNG